MLQASRLVIAKMNMLSTQPNNYLPSQVAREELQQHEALHRGEEDSGQAPEHPQGEAQEDPRGTGQRAEQVHTVGE